MITLDIPVLIALVALALVCGLAIGSEVLFRPRDAGPPWGRVGDGSIGRGPQRFDGKGWTKDEPRCVRRVCHYSRRPHTIQDHLRGTVTPVPNGHAEWWDRYTKSAIDTHRKP